MCSNLDKDADLSDGMFSHRINSALLCSCSFIRITWRKSGTGRKSSSSHGSYYCLPKMRSRIFLVMRLASCSKRKTWLVFITFSGPGRGQRRSSYSCQIFESSCVITLNFMMTVCNRERTFHLRQNKRNMYFLFFGHSDFGWHLPIKSHNDVKLRFHIRNKGVSN